MGAVVRRRLSLLWVFATCLSVNPPSSAEEGRYVRTHRAESRFGWAIPNTLAACPRGESKLVNVQGVCLTKTEITRCNEDWIQEDIYRLRGEEVDVEHASWSITGAFELTLGADVVGYEIWVAPVSKEPNQVGGVLGATWPVFYLAPIRKYPASVRDEWELPKLPSWVIESAPPAKDRPECEPDPELSKLPEAEH